ncbi:MAG: hypothetical protein FJ197_04615 [Gammaproteobacteria bacterium]|nr:hypothetical protein [Gammaproteobacteria bacterium]
MSGPAYGRLLHQALLAALTSAAFAGCASAGLPDPDWHIAAPAAATEPAHAEYHALSRALVLERARAANGEPVPVADGAALQAGVRDPRVATLRDRLKASGDYAAEMGADPWFFDRALDEALRRLQRRHGLAADGIIGERTLAALNRTSASLVDQLEVALERWRWLPADLGSTHVWVNIARAQLDVVENGESSLSMRVVVGHSNRPTPSLTGRLDRVVFNPEWAVPRRIAIEDLLPRQQADPGFLATQGFRVLTSGGAVVDPASVMWSDLGPDRFPYRLVQAPGPGNSLGRIKIAFDNEHDIYLHDTPSRGLFALTTRSLSSGCVRLEEPSQFATYLLARNSAWDASMTAAALASPATKTMRLTDGLPIYLVYITAWTEDGEVRFGRDLYGRDAAVLAALRNRRTIEVKL